MSDLNEQAVQAISQAISRPHGYLSRGRAWPHGYGHETPDEPLDQWHRRVAQEVLRLLAEQGIVLVEQPTEEAHAVTLLCEENDRIRAELEVLRDLKARVVGFGGDDYTVMPWIDAHRLHADEPYIGCPFCRDRFVEQPTKPSPVLRLEVEPGAYGVEVDKAVAKLEQPTKPCEKCGGSGEVWLGSQPYGSPGESYAPCPACIGSGTVPVVFVDRDALVGEIVKWLREQAEKVGTSGVKGDSYDGAADTIERRFAPKADKT